MCKIITPRDSCIKFLLHSQATGHKTTIIKKITKQPYLTAELSMNIVHGRGQDFKSDKLFKSHSLIQYLTMGPYTTCKINN